MVTYFFNCRADASFSLDEEGQELPDIGAAHLEALKVLGDAIQDAAIEGAADQHFAVEVRDELGPVLEISAVFASKILRKQ